MAGGAVISSSQPGKHYPGGFTWYVFLTCFVGASGGLIFGYDLGISGGVTSMTPFLKKFFPDVYRKQSGIQSSNQYCKFDSHALTFFTSSLYIAALVSCLLASKITKSFGRRFTMITGGALLIIGAIVNGFAENLVMLYVGRFLLGFGVGFANQSVPVYLSEMAPQNLRGCLNMLFQLAITIGIFVSSIINYFTGKRTDDFGWKLSLGLAAIPGFIIFFGGLFLYDSPNSLIERDQLHEAKTVLKKIRGTKDIHEEYSDLLAASEASKKVTSPWKRLLFDRKYRPQLTFAIGIPSFQQFTGINVVMFYAPVLFQTLGFGGSALLMSSLISGGVNMVATGIALYLADRKGRRTLFLLGGLQMLIFQCIVGGLIGYKFGYSGVATLSKGYAVAVVFCICAYVAGFAYSWGPLGWLVPSEIFPLEVRSAAQSINVSANMLWTFCIGQAFLWLLCHVKFWLFFGFVVFVLAMTIFIFLLFPETKGIPIEGMYEVWERHWFWRKYVGGGSGLELDVKKHINNV
ncbi:Sugar transport protein mst3 [Ranunculus cassubicifolius]